MSCMRLLAARVVFTSVAIVAYGFLAFVSTVDRAIRR